MVSLTRNNPRERVDWACGVALERGVFRYQVLRRLADRASADTPRPQLTQEHPLIRDLREYAEEVTA
jgi:hypothetical protein